jgi:uroporphyrinogen-III decarboxylase
MRETMLPRERLATAIAGGTPDRVPVVPKIWVDLGAALTGTDLCDVITDPMAALRVVLEAGRLCRADAIRVFHLPARTIRRDGGKVLEVDAAGAVMGEIDMQGGLHTTLRDPALFDFRNPFFTAHDHFWTANAPLVRDHAEADAIAVPGQDDFVEFGWDERQSRLAAEAGDAIALIGDCSAATMAFLVSMRGMTCAMMDVLDEPELAHRIIEKGVEIAIAKARFHLDRGIEVLRLNDSVGNMNVISPQHWREFVFPHMKEFCDTVHAMSPGARIYCHICGNVLPILEDLVETGLDCIGPLDPLGGFTPSDARARVGDRAALMGGVNTMTLANGTPDDVLAESRACIEQAGQNGGYILGSGCAIPRTASLENLAALREAAERFGKYPM